MALFGYSCWSSEEGSWFWFLDWNFYSSWFSFQFEVMVTCVWEKHFLSTGWRSLGWFLQSCDEIIYNIKLQFKALKSSQSLFFKYIGFACICEILGSSYFNEEYFKFAAILDESLVVLEHLACSRFSMFFGVVLLLHQELHLICCWVVIHNHLFWFHWIQDLSVSDCNSFLQPHLLAIFLLEASIQVQVILLQ